MSLFDVYSLLDVEPVTARGAYLWDAQGNKYLDFYGGHAVISIGHCHPTYVKALTRQAGKIGFYSNAVHNQLQVEVGERLPVVAGYPDYSLFLCNSGAEANENALKLASFHTGRDRVVAMHGAFHGRTSAAVAITDNPSIQAPVNRGHKVTFVDMNDVAQLEVELAKGDVAAVIVEGIQGVGGIRTPTPTYLQAVRTLCDKTGTVMIVDEVQSGCGRTGRYFAHQWTDVQPDIISMAKGIGNGFPVAAILISPRFEARKGMLGTTFGGSHLACAAMLAVLEVIVGERLMANAATLGQYLIDEVSSVEGVSEVRGRGLMIGVDLTVPQAEFRKRLLTDYGILTGYSGTNTLRLLPPLTIGYKEIKPFLSAFRATLKNCLQAQ